jgi:hypothetical protein
MALGGSLEDNVLTALCWSKNLAPQIALTLTADDFSTGPYRQIAATALKFFAEYREPARGHLADLLEHEIRRGGHDGDFIGTVLREMEDRLAPLLNEDFVLAELDGFLTKQRMFVHASAAGELLQNDKIEAARIQFLLGAAVRPPTLTLPDPWGDPTPPAFDADVLPPVLRGFVTERSRSMGWDPAALFWTALSCCSAALDGQIRLRMKPRDRLGVPPGVWVMLFGESGTGKTQILNTAWGALDRADEEAYDEWLVEKRRWEQDGKHGKEPVCPQYVAQDTTVEGVRKILVSQDRGVGVKLDEGAQLIGQFDRYTNKGGAAANRAFWVRGYDGGPSRINRAGEGFMLIRNHHIVPCCGIQPDKLSEFHKHSNLTSDGLLQRMITPIMKPVAVAVDDGDYGGREVQDYETLVNHLTCTKRRDRDHMLRLSPAAAAVEQRVEERIRRWAANNELGPGFRTFASKGHGLWGRVTLVLHHVFHAKGAVPEIIDLDAAELAEELLFGQVIPCGMELYKWLGASSGNITLTQSVASYLLADDEPRYVFSDFAPNVHECRGKTLKQVQEAVSPLEAYGILSREDHPRGYSWVINPQFRIQFAARRAQQEVDRAQLRDAISEAAERRRAEKRGRNPEEQDQNPEKPACAREEAEKPNPEKPACACGSSKKTASLSKTRTRKQDSQDIMENVAEAAIHQPGQGEADAPRQDGTSVAWAPWEQKEGPPPDVHPRRDFRHPLFRKWP